MKRMHPLTSKPLALCSLWAAGIFIAPGQADTDVDAPAVSQIRAETDISMVAPTNTFYGTRGLSQTASAEALGEGRLTFGLYGTWYRQRMEFEGGPNRNAQIFTGLGSASLGINRHIDLFATFSGFGSVDYETGSGSGIGAASGGLQGTLPLPQKNPIRMAAQVALIQGFSDNGINENDADGYDYFETRSGLDFMVKLIQTIALGPENTSFKLHFNEGIVTSAESGTEAQMLLGAGVQVNIFAAVLGLEVHSRTPFQDIEIESDPLWATPSLQIRTPYDLNLTLGGDISLSTDREDAIGNRALEPYRLFAGLAFTFDTQYGKRAAVKAEAQRELAEKEALRNRNQNLQQNLADQAREDSLARAEMRASTDSASLAQEKRANLDSSRMAEKARKDSLALVQAQANLKEEKSKRSEAEKQLLSTGMLLLDAVYFESGETVISINSKPYLNIIAKMLTKYPKLRIEVAGHTDNVGSETMNQTLSQGRAESVAAYMVQESPSLRGILSSKGYAFSQPKAENDTPHGRKLNRRTELHVLNQDVLADYNR